MTNLKEYINDTLKTYETWLDDTDWFENQLKLYGKITIYKSLLLFFETLPDNTIITINQIRNKLNFLDRTKNDFDDEMLYLNDEYCFLSNFVKGKFEAIQEIYKFMSKKNDNI